MTKTKTVYVVSVHRGPGLRWVVLLAADEREALSEACEAVLVDAPYCLVVADRRVEMTWHFPPRLKTERVLKNGPRVFLTREDAFRFCADCGR